MARESNSSESQFDARQRLENMFRECPIPAEDLMTNLGLYMRGSALVKLLVLDDLYRRILPIPGAIVEFGCWYGQNLVLWENMRAIYEPFNTDRHIVGFDTFGGYAGHSKADVASEIFAAGNFDTLSRWPDQITELLRVHEANNAFGHITGKHRVIPGDVRETAPKFFEENRGTVVALAYFDMGLYEPTKAALEAIRPHLVQGSVILLDEFQWKDSPGEAIAFKEVFAGRSVKIEKCALTPRRAIITVG